MFRIGNVSVSRTTKNVHIAALSEGEAGGPVPDQGTTDTFGIKKKYQTLPYGNSWSSTQWNNGISRTLSNPGTCVPDPYDPRLSLNDAGDPKLIIDGAGIAKATTLAGMTASPRFVVFGGWKNVESSLYVRSLTATHSTSNIDLREKTDHYCVDATPPETFGGYISNVNFMNQNTSERKERDHDIGYSDFQATAAITSTANTWLGIKGICYTLANGNVKLETYTDTTDGAAGGTWTLKTQATDNGTWGGVGGSTPIQNGVYRGSAIRCNIDAVDGYFEFKRWSIREINPNVALF